MINWILAYVAMVVYFMVRFNYRKNKTKFDFKFWFKDNLSEIITSVLTVFLLMILLTDENASFDLSYFIEKVPFIQSLPMDKLISIFIGFTNTALFYLLFRLKKQK